MKEHKLEFKFKVYESASELSVADQELVQLATEQLDRAYAPYSKFYVGAAVSLQNGNTYVGCNQENASYPLCICGERVALFNAGANEPNEPIDTIAILARNPANPILQSPISPCGACRQVISEFEQRHNTPIRLLLKGDDDFIYEIMASDLLPLSFDSSFL